MLMEAYFDDSSDEKREKFYACGGLIGSPDQWDGFDMAWSSVTCDLEQPFRSADCEGGHEQFVKWSKPKRDDLMRRLTNVIYETGLHGYVSIVPVPKYKRVFSDAGEHDPFLLALRQTVMNTAYIAETLKEDIKLWFEKGNTDAAILRVYNSIADFKDWKPTRRLSAISFDNKKLRPLQAADLIAREGFKHITNLGIRKIRKPAMKLTGTVYFHLWGSDSLQFLADHGGPDNLGLLVTWDEHKDAPRLISGVMKPVRWGPEYDR
jgi:hypothetical protein